MPRVLRRRQRINYKEPPLRTPSRDETPSTMMLPHVRRARASSKSQLSPVVSSPPDASPTLSPVVRRRKRSTKGKRTSKGKSKKAVQDENAGDEENKGVEAGTDSDDDFVDAGVKRRAKATKRKSTSGRGGRDSHKKARRSPVSTTEPTQATAVTDQADSVPEKTPGLLRAARMALARQPAKSQSPAAASTHDVASPEPVPTPCDTPEPAAPPPSEVKKAVSKGKRRGGPKHKRKAKAARGSSASPGALATPPAPATRLASVPATPFDASKMIADLKSALGAATQVPAPQPTPSKQAAKHNERVQTMFDELKALRCTEPERALKEAREAWAKKEAAQQRLIEQLQQQLANQGASGTLSPPDASGDINAQAASAVAKAAAAKTAELQKQVEKLQQKNRQLTDAAAALQAKADTAATERDACLASLARAESESATIQSVYSKMTSLTIDVSEGVDGNPTKLECMAINKADRKGVAFTLTVPSLEDEDCEVTYQPTKNLEFLPEFMQEPLAFELNQLPQFTLNLVEGLYEDDEEEDDEEEDADADGDADADDDAMGGGDTPAATQPGAAPAPENTSAAAAMPTQVIASDESNAVSDGAAAN